MLVFTRCEQTLPGGLDSEQFKTGIIHSLSTVRCTLHSQVEWTNWVKICGLTFAAESLMSPLLAQELEWIIKTEKDLKDFRVQNTLACVCPLASTSCCAQRW